MTELCTIVTFPQMDKRIGTIGSGGVLLPGCIARVVKPDGSLAKLGEAGELVVTSPSVSLGYLNNAEAYVPSSQHIERLSWCSTTSCRTAETFKDGWVVTGDEVYFNERKEIFVVDRIKVPSLMFLALLSVANHTSSSCRN